MIATLAEVLFPGVCPGCGRPGEPLCDACERSVRPPPTHLPIPAGLDGLHVAFAYDGVVRELVARAKYRQRHAALRWLGARAASVVPERATVDVVTWVPTTTARRRARGFDQAERLARVVGAAARRPVRPALRRVTQRTQTGHGRDERMLGPEFRLGAGVRVDGSRVLLVDDVVTTGATMRTAAAALRAAGAASVVGVAMARRP